MSEKMIMSYSKHFTGRNRLTINITKTYHQHYKNVLSILQKCTINTTKTAMSWYTPGWGPLLHVNVHCFFQKCCVLSHLSNKDITLQKIIIKRNNKEKQWGSFCSALQYFAVGHQCTQHNSRSTQIHVEK